MWGVEMSVPARPVAEQGLRRCVLFNVVQGNVLRFLPPLVVTEQQVNQALDILEEILNEQCTRRVVQEEEQIAHVA